MKKWTQQLKLGATAVQRVLIDIFVASGLILLGSLTVIGAGWCVVAASRYAQKRPSLSWRQLFSWRLAWQSALLTLAFLTGGGLLSLPLWGWPLGWPRLLQGMLLTSCWGWGSVLLSASCWGWWRLSRRGQLRWSDRRQLGLFYRAAGGYLVAVMGLVLLGAGLIWLWPASCLVVLGSLCYCGNHLFDLGQQRLIRMKESVG